MITASLETTLKNMKDLKSFSFDNNFDVQVLDDIMESNAVQLEHFGFLLNTIGSIEDQIQTIRTCQSLSTISSLGINCAFDIDTIALSNALIESSYSWKHMISLKVTYYSSNLAILLITVLQGLDTLKSLEIWDLFIMDTLSNNELFYNKISDIHRGKLESLCLSRFRVTDDRDLERLGLLFSFIVQSCPSLKRMELAANFIWANGTVNLDFREDPFMQYIQTYMPDCRFFTFHHETAKI